MLDDYVLGLPEPPKRRKRTGDSLEARIRKSTDVQERHGLSLIQTSPRTVGRHGQDGHFRGRVVSKGTLDFVGHFRGRAVMLDAKSTASRTRFDLSLIKTHQATIIKNAHAQGAIAFLLVEFTQPGGRTPCYYAVDWTVLGPYWEGFMLNHYGQNNPASIPFSTIAESCVEVARNGQVLDMVNAIVDLQERMGAAS